MSASIRSTSTLDENKQEFLAHLREATTTLGPVSSVLADPSLMRVLARPSVPRRGSSSSRNSSKTQKSAKPETPDVPLLSLVLAEEDRKSNQLRTLLRSTTDRLEYEMRRAEAAERRAEYAEARVKQANDRMTNLTRIQHQTELTVTRAVEEAKRYKMLLDNTQAELHRAEQDIDDLENQKARAESQARQARDVSRQYEKALSEHEAKEAGRQEGMKQMSHRFVEGIEAGRREGYEVAKKQERARRRKMYMEAFEAGRAEGYDEGNEEGRSHERRNALDAFDQFLENEGYSEESSSRSSSSGSRH